MLHKFLKSAAVREVLSEASVCNKILRIKSKSRFILGTSFLLALYQMNRAIKEGKTMGEKLKHFLRVCFRTQFANDDERLETAKAYIRVSIGIIITDLILFLIKIKLR